jgi:hypothetical protein
VIPQGASPPVDAPARPVRRARIETLEDLIATLNTLDDARRDALFRHGDLILEYARARGADGADPQALKALCAAIAAGSRLSRGFLYSLARVAAAFPPDLRDLYADKPWAWFLECAREPDPLAAAERYADMSIAQIKDFRRSRPVAREPGAARLQVTLRADQVADLLSGRPVTVERLLRDETPVLVTVRPVRRAP